MRLIVTVLCQIKQAQIVESINSRVSGATHFSSVAQSFLTLCDPMDCSRPGFPVYQQLAELAQTPVHRVGDAIQPSHPLLSPFLRVFLSIRVFSSDSVLCFRWPKY